jgi:hypothetical protein
MAATKADPIAQREDLYEQLDRAEQRGDAVDVAQRRADAELRAAHAALAEGRISEVLGDVPASEVERLKIEVERLETVAADAHAATVPVGAAIRRVRNSIERLHRDHRDAFIADATAAAELAADALEELRAPYQKAYDQWSAAQSRFARFVGDLVDIGPAPSWPFASPIELFEASATERRTGRVLPRRPIPAQLAEPCEPTPEAPGTRHYWEREDGYRLTSTVGDDLDQSLEADPIWRLVKVEAPAEA